MRRFGSLAAVTALAVSVGIEVSAGTGTAEPVPRVTTFAFSGGPQSFVVPAGVDELRVEAFGGHLHLTRPVRFDGEPGGRGRARRSALHRLTRWSGCLRRGQDGSSP